MIDYVAAHAVFDGTPGANPDGWTLPYFAYHHLRRRFLRYRGDGITPAVNGLLRDGGDPLYGPYPLSWSDVDAFLLLFASNYTDDLVPPELQALITSLRNGQMINRPGDAPDNFELGGATLFISAYGAAVQTSTPTRIVQRSFTPILPDTLASVIYGFFRVSDPVDPAGDAVGLGIEWYKADKGLIKRELIRTDTTLREADGRRVVRRLVEPFGTQGAEIEAPANAAYLRPYLETFGVDHVTGADLIGAQVSELVNASDVLFQEGFQWPEEVIRPIPITATHRNGSEPGLYQPDPETQIPADWVKPIPITPLDGAGQTGPGLYQPALEVILPRSWVGDYEMAGTLFVSGGGENSNDGRSLTAPVRDIDRAIEIAAAAPETDWSIQMWPGLYATPGNLDVPDNVEIVGVQGQRSVVLRPTPGNETNNVFNLGSGGMLRNLSAVGWQVDDLSHPRSGFLAAFRQDALILRTLYIEHCVMYRDRPPVLIPPNLNPEAQNPAVGNGPGLVLADANTASPYSPFAQVMIEASTVSAPNGIGVVARGNTYVNAINAVTMWAHIHYRAEGGALLALTNCETQMGDYALWSEGARPVPLIGTAGVPLLARPAAAQTLREAKAALEDAMWAAVLDAGWGQVDEVLSRRDAGFLVDALAYDLEAGRQESTEIFIQGIHRDGAFVGAGQEGAFIAGWVGMKNAITGSILPGQPGAEVASLIDLILDSVQNPRFRQQPSVINASPVKMSLPFAGVNLRAFYRPPRDARQAIVERDLGRVVFSGYEDSGKQFFTGGALVNALTGKFEGPPVNRTINPIARRAAIIQGGQ
ncbi:hypothetical protein [Thalassococcus sp. S3]|uniref:hypothetical protein n=1 Tax=Thalassococcus sp. S3 TaxID=2017482 RepID=UPI0010245E10|nr:hypothetical protein [Thalassococcus sp. S3]QBF32137.1 hypothetical protein CFI11_13040 [Thalassococcus sp. S3]